MPGIVGMNEIADAQAQEAATEAMNEPESRQSTTIQEVHQEDTAIKMANQMGELGAWQNISSVST